jgi:hypothetical protein
LEEAMEKQRRMQEEIVLSRNLQKVRLLIQVVDA